MPNNWTNLQIFICIYVAQCDIGIHSIAVHSLVDASVLQHSIVIIHVNVCVCVCLWTPVGSIIL